MAWARVWPRRGVAAFLDGVHGHQQLVGAVFVEPVVFARGQIGGLGLQGVAGVLAEDLGEGGIGGVAVGAGQGEDAAAGAVFTAAGVGDGDAGDAGGGMIQVQAVGFRRRVMQHSGRLSFLRRMFRVGSGRGPAGKSCRRAPGLSG